MNVAPLWVMTRAQPDADADVEALRAAGITALALPCIERVALAWPQWNPTGTRVILVSSSFGAQQLLAAWPTLAEPKPFVAAMAPATAARLEKGGISVEVRAEGGIVTLAHALRDWQRRRGGALAVLYATSDAGTQQPEQEEALALMQTFAQVERVAVYSTRAPPGLEERLSGLNGPVSFAFMSPSAVEQALARLPRALFPQKVACIGHSTLRRYTELSAKSGATHYPSFEAFLSALIQEKP